MKEIIVQIAAKLRSVFSPGEFQKRYDDGKIQVLTHNGRVVEKKEAFPYGFYARAKGGRVFVLCQGGNMDSAEIFPVLPGGDITPPRLEAGDAALYTGNGARVIVRESGGVEVYAAGNGGVKVTSEEGTLYFANGKTNSCKILLGLIDEIKEIVTSGAPPAHTVNEASKKKLDAYKNKIKELYAEAE